MSERMERSRKRGIAVVGALLGGTLAGGALLGQGAIARDLQPSAEHALTDADISGVGVSFYGREATLTGQHKTAKERQQAIAAVESVRGVRWAKFPTHSSDSTGTDKSGNSGQSTEPAGGNDSGNKGASEGFDISLASKAGELQATGSIDTKENADTLLGEAHRIFGTAPSGDLTVEPNVAMPSWWGDLTKAMVKFPEISAGSLKITSDGISLSGAVADPTDLDSLSAALKDASFSVDNTVTVDPAFTMTTNPSGGATLKGNVASQADSDAIAAEATRIYGGPIDNQLAVVPEAQGSTWFPGFAAALKNVPPLTGGALKVSADGLDVSGSVPTGAELGSLSTAVRALPFTITNTVTAADGSTAASTSPTGDGTASGGASPAPSASGAASMSPGSSTSPSETAGASSPSPSATVPAPSPSPSAAPASAVTPEQIAQINGTVINYANFSYGLDAAAKAKLDAIIPILRSSPIGLTINGYVSTPHRGNETADSARRAQAVADYLVAAGIDPSRLTVAGLGAANPVAPNDSAQGRFANQRATLTVKGN